MRRTRRRDRLSLESVGRWQGRADGPAMASRAGGLSLSLGPVLEDIRGRGKEGGPVARKGDRIVVNARRVGGPAREGEIIEVIEGERRVQYRVRWNDGHESLFAPGAGASRIEPARDGEKTSSVGTEPNKVPATASTAKKSTAKTAKKSPAKKSAVRKVAAKKVASRGRTGNR